MSSSDDAMDDIDSLEALGERLYDEGFHVEGSKSANGQRVWMAFGMERSRKMWASVTGGRLELSLDIGALRRPARLDEVAQQINRTAFCLKAIVLRKDQELSLRAVTASTPLRKNVLDLSAALLHIESFVDEILSVGDSLALLEPTRDGEVRLARPKLDERPRPIELAVLAAYAESVLGVAAERVPTGFSFTDGTSGVRRHLLAIEHESERVENLVLLEQRAMRPRTWTEDDDKRLNALSLHRPPVCAFISEDRTGFATRVHAPLGQGDPGSIVTAAAEALVAYATSSDVREAFEAFDVRPR
jgi:hypothetical protein